MEFFDLVLRGSLDEVNAYLSAGKPVDCRPNLEEYDDKWVQSGDTALISATRHNKLDMVKLLLQHGADIEATNARSVTAILCAAYYGYIEIVQLLLEHNADIHKCDCIGRSIVMVATTNGHVETVKLLLKHGASLSGVCGNNGNTALMFACKSNMIEMLRFLLLQGHIDINAQNRSGRTALMIAAEKGHYQVVELLLANSTELEIRDNKLRTALMIAAGEGNLEVVKLLLQHGADPHVRDDEDSTALSIAVDNKGNRKFGQEHESNDGYVDIVRVLLNAGVNVNELYEGRTVLLIATQKGNLDIVRVLLEEYGADYQSDIALCRASFHNYIRIVKLLLAHGVPVNGRGDAGRTPLIEAAEYGHLRLFRLLLKNGGDLSAVTDRGWTALMRAIHGGIHGGGHLHLVKELLKLNVDIHVVDKSYGESALSKAARGGYEDILGLLLSRGADSNQASKHGMTPLMFAARQGHTRCIKLLLKHGANAGLRDHKGKTALMMASSRVFSAVRALLRNEKNEVINAQSNFGWTSLMLTSIHDRATVVSYLIKHGADIHLQTKNGLNALIAAASRGNLEVVEVLVDSGANLDVQCKNGWTALMYAVANGYGETASYLLALGANVNIQSKHGTTALIAAVRYADIEVVHEILKYSPDIALKEDGYNTALMVAIASDNLAMVRALLNHERGFLSYSDEVWRLTLHDVIPYSLPDICYLRSLNIHSKMDCLRDRMRLVQQSLWDNCQHLVSRDRVLEGAFEDLNPILSDTRKYYPLVVYFMDENGYDNGGLCAEFFTILSRQLVKEENKLFVSHDNNFTFQPDARSRNLANCDEYYRFIGRLVGKAIITENTLDELVFSLPFLKHILELPITLEDLRCHASNQVEANYLYNSLQRILENPVDSMQLDFAHGTRGNEDAMEVEEELVTEENKEEYVRLWVAQHTTHSIARQIAHFLEGLYSLIPKHFLQIFSPEELTLIINGQPVIDINYLQSIALYENGYSCTDDCIQWLWEVLREESAAIHKRFLQFITGSSRVTLSLNSFIIYKVAHSTSLPSAHTCAKQLSLPQYYSKEELRDKLLLALMEGAEGFGFV